MAYIINRTDGTQLVVLEDGTLDTSTSIGLVGRNYVGYGEIQNENFLYLLENFSADYPPARPIQGQLWFSRLDSNIQVYTGTEWKPVGFVDVAETEPTGSTGALWFNTELEQLSVYDGTAWKEVGPEAVEGFGKTRLQGQKILGSDNNQYPVLSLYVDDQILAIYSKNDFVISSSTTVSGFTEISKGLTVSNDAVFKGRLSGSAETADRLTNARTINGVIFDGQSNITITSNTTNSLTVGDYLTGSNFNGSSASTISVDASSNNIIGKVVVRDSSGDFSAGEITAETGFVGDLTGNVSTSTGTSTFNIVQANQFVGATLSGNAFTATRLLNARTINGIPFDGSANITVGASAETLSGTTINGSITSSSLTSVGFLNSLNVRSSGLQVGDYNDLKLAVYSNIPTIRSQNGYGIDTIITDTAFPLSEYKFRYIGPSTSTSLSGESKPSFVPGTDLAANIGHPSLRFNSGYVDSLNASEITATTINTSSPDNNLTITSNLVIDGDLVVSGSNTVVNSTSLTVADKEIVIAKGSTTGAQADGAGLLVDGAGAYFKYTSAGGGKWQTNINLEATSSNFIGTLVGTATNNVAKTGDSMAGYLTLHADPVNAYHAATKQYVDNNAAYQITYGNTQYSTSGYTNQVGSFNDGANFFDVYPPSGKTMADLIAFMPSIAVIYFAGGVDGNDRLRCTWSNLGDRIRVYVQNTEQNGTPAANWIAFWR